MKVLVAVASRHGATRELGRTIADALRSAAHEVDLVDPDDVESLDGYDAVVLGSSVYVGRWAASARALVDRLAADLARRPVWLFSSGPVGNPPVPAGDPEEIASLSQRIGAQGHQVFAGRLDTGDLTLAERAVVALVQAERGDFREWDQAAAWGTAIAEELHVIDIDRLHRGSS